MTISFLVLARIFANPLSNVFQKKLTNQSINPLFIIFVTYLLLSFVSLPFFFLHSLSLKLTGQFWGYILVSAVLAVAGNTCIVTALKLADLSVLGPINTYKSIVSLLLGTILLGEIPTLMGFAGMLLIISGSYFIVDEVSTSPGAGRFAGFIKSPGIRLRFAALILSATEAIFLKKAVLLSSPPLTFFFWCFLGVPLALAALLFLTKVDSWKKMVTTRQTIRFYLLLTLTTGLMQLSTLYTFTVFQVSYSLALFQTSTILSVIFGYRFFHEKNILRKLIGALIMIAGAVLIITLGSPA